VKTWYNGQSRGVTRGLFYEFFVRKVLEDNDFFISRGVNYQVKNDKLFCMPDFVLPDNSKPRVIIFVSHYETPSNSQYMFYETIEELFEYKINYGNQIVCVNLIFGRKDGWTKWLLHGFEELFDYCICPDDAKINYYEDFLQIYDNCTTYEGFLKRLKFLLQKNCELMQVAQDLGQNLITIVKRGQPKTCHFDLWNIERNFYNSVDVDQQKENIKKLFPNQIHSFSSTRNLESKSVVIDDSQSSRVGSTMINELRNPEIIDHKVKLLLKLTNNLSVDEDRIASILRKCSKNPKLYGFDGPGNWILLLLVEFSGLKRNSLRNEANRMAQGEGIKNPIPYLYYNKELTSIQARLLSNVLLDHLHTRLNKAALSFEQLAKNVKYQILERYRNTLLHNNVQLKSIIRTHLERSRIICSLIKGYPEKAYVFVETLFRDLIPDLKGYEGKVGRIFQIVYSSESSIYIHSRQAVKSSVQHRSSEQSGIARVLRYRYMDGKIIQNPQIKDLVFIPIGYWRHHDLLRLCLSGMKVFPLGKELTKYLEFELGSR